MDPLCPALPCLVEELDSQFCLFRFSKKKKTFSVNKTTTLLPDLGKQV